MRVRVTERADDDILGILEFVGRDEWPPAERLLAELNAAVDSLQELPRRGFRPKGIPQPSVRAIRVRDWLVLYEVGKDVEVLRVVDGNRDLRQLPLR
ncbi:MAG: type II toxin-antitoxin system RelE/ParE family toxin [Dehalococcoidia bacterium]|nr:type II toxin-antitoxin system RelE/ParE family toxin [Dehalococcoidia bacterium]